MLDILKYLLENSDERFTKQIQYIMDQLSADYSKEKSDILSKSQTLSESNDEDNDVDDLDEEDDLAEEEELEESIHLEKSFPLGEDLLTKYFVLPIEEGSKQTNLVKSFIKDQQQNTSKISENKSQDQNMFKRPTTPSLVSNNVSTINDKPRETPTELKSRPKILRTPLEGANKESFQEQKEEDPNSSKLLSYNKESPFMNDKKIELRVIELIVTLT